MKIESARVNLSVVGQGYVGLHLAIAASQAGHMVFGIDTNEALVGQISRCNSPIGDVSDHQISDALSSGSYTATTKFDSVRSADIVIVCVPTPLNESREPDFSYLISALKSIAPNLKAGALVINESTVSPGTTRDLIASVLNQANTPYELAYSPERIDPANKDWTIANTPKLVSGLTPQATERAANFYRSFVSNVTTGTSPEVIEAAKLLENSFRLINISFINEFAELCEAMDIDVREVISAASTKPYGFMPFYPGAGIGGHCIPVDPSYLVAKAREIGAATKFIDLANEINAARSSHFVNMAEKKLKNLSGKKIILVGVAYKANVADIRETPAAPILEILRSRNAQVSWHDDLVKEWRGEQSTPLNNNFDLAILINPHRSTDLSLLGTVPRIDTRGAKR